MASSTVTVPVVRGCGVRKKGGVYAEVPTSPFGQSIEYFLIDSPVVVDKEGLGLSEIGVKLIENNGVYHVWDIIGQEHYPNVADFVEECSRFGVSRRLPTTLDFSLLTKESRLIVLHARASINNAGEYYKSLDKMKCPKGKTEHALEGTPSQMCAGLWWHDIVDGKPFVNEDRARPFTRVVRAMPSLSYDGDARPESLTPDYSLAVFASFPLRNIAVVNDPDEGTHEAAMARASRASLGGVAVELVDE